MKGGALLTQVIRYLVFAVCNCEGKVISKHDIVLLLGPIEAKNESHSKLREKWCKSLNDHASTVQPSLVGNYASQCGVNYALMNKVIPFSFQHSIMQTITNYSRHGADVLKKNVLFQETNQTQQPTDQPTDWETNG